MRPDAKAALTAAFDNAVNEPHKTSGHLSKKCFISGRWFEFQTFSIGYATFFVATRHHHRSVLVDAILRDGRPTYNLIALPVGMRKVLRRSIMDEINAFLG